MFFIAQQVLNTSYLGLSKFSYHYLFLTKVQSEFSFLASHIAWIFHSGSTFSILNARPYPEKSNEGSKTQTLFMPGKNDGQIPWIILKPELKIAF